MVSFCSYNPQHYSYNPSDDDNPNCCICLEEFVDEVDNPIVAHKANSNENELLYHPSHKKCMQLWLERNPTCPICRISVDSSSLYRIGRKIDEGDLITEDMIKGLLLIGGVGALALLAGGTTITAALAIPSIRASKQGVYLVADKGILKNAAGILADMRNRMQFVTKETLSLMKKNKPLAAATFLGASAALAVGATSGFIIAAGATCAVTCGFFSRKAAQLVGK